MGYCASGSGTAEFSRCLSSQEEEPILKALKSSCFEFDFYYVDPETNSIKNNSEYNRLDFWDYDKYYEDELQEVLEAIAGSGALIEGCITYTGEDGEHWRFIWQDGKWKEQYGEIVYHDC